MDSELNLEPDASDRRDGDAFHSGNMPTSRAPTRCKKPKFQILHIANQRSPIDRVPNPCHLENSLHHTRIARSIAVFGTPLWEMHRSRFEELCACCAKYSIPEMTKHLAHFLSIWIWKNRVYGKPDDWSTRAVITICLRIACERHNLSITPEMIGIEFGALPNETSYRHFYDLIAHWAPAFIPQFPRWLCQGSPRNLLMWKMANKRQDSNFCQLLDRPDSVRKLEYSMVQGYVTSSHSHRLY